jgi:ParB family chromosome partitioning protein
MAKRKRLNPAISAGITPAAPTLDPGQAKPSLAMPIARVAGDNAAAAALEEIAGELVRAEIEGRLIRTLELREIDTEYLVRDRIVVEDDAMQALKQSLRSRGQQTPIEVQMLPERRDGDPRFGLISGWRRMLALHQLVNETGNEEFGQVLALIRQPDTLVDSYVAMVEENEIRTSLSYFERARIAFKARGIGLYESDKQALQSLFSSASYARRSKIKSFLTVVEALDGYLHFPTLMTEREGLALAQALKQYPQLVDNLKTALTDQPPITPEEEKRLLEVAQDQVKKGAQVAEVGAPVSDAAASRFRRRKITPGIALRAVDGRVELLGKDVDAAFIARLEAWVRQQE